jgi:hypothetical protein
MKDRQELRWDREKFVLVFEQSCYHSNGAEALVAYGITTPRVEYTWTNDRRQVSEIHFTSCLFVHVGEGRDPF